MTAIVSDLINELKTIGYALYLDGESLKYRYTALTEPPKERVILLLDTLKRNKGVIIEYLKDKSKVFKYCTWLEKDIPSSECFDWCIKADRTPSTCKYFRDWWRAREKQLIEAGVIKCRRKTPILDSNSYSI